MMRQFGAEWLRTSMCSCWKVRARLQLRIESVTDEADRTALFIGKFRQDRRATGVPLP
jgi:hypothetical protein